MLTPDFSNREFKILQYIQLVIGPLHGPFELAPFGAFGNFQLLHGVFLMCPGLTDRNQRSFLERAFVPARIAAFELPRERNFPTRCALAKLRLDLGAGRARSCSTNGSKYLLRSNPESVARRSMAATLSEGIRNVITCVISLNIWAMT